jgi:hypothetical protein
MWICEVQWKESITVPVYKKCNKTGCRNYLDISMLSASYKLLSNAVIVLPKLNPYQIKLFVIVSAGFNETDQLLITFLRY